MFYIVALFLIFVLSLIYINGKYNERYWKKRGVKFYKKHKVTGVYWDFIIQRKPLFTIFHSIYKDNPDEPAVGIGTFLTPSLYVIDPLNVQHVLHNDFQSFNHRGTEVNPGDILADNVLFMHGPRWKLVRQSMTPLFTSTKLKNMYYIMDKCAQDFVKFLKDNPDRLSGDTFDTLTSFCNAAIGAAVFGIGTNSIFDSPFLKMGRNSFNATVINSLKFTTSVVSKPLFKLLNLKFFTDYEHFFVSAIKKVISVREKENVAKHDFVDLCVSIKKNGSLKDLRTGLVLESTDELLAAQGFFFFIAGIEPTASGIFGAMIELGRNPEILERVHKEIDKEFEKTDGQLTYDSVAEMGYLDMVVSEGLRMYPPIGYLTRKCIQDTILPVGNIKVEKGTTIYTPIYEMHHDARYFPNPEVFDPERFSDESNQSNMAYMPFGKGGRICIGLRYAKLQIKAGMMHLLRHYTLKTVVDQGGIQYRNDAVQVRMQNVKVHFIPRDQEKLQF